MTSSQNPQKWNYRMRAISQDQSQEQLVRIGPLRPPPITPKNKAGGYDWKRASERARLLHSANEEKMLEILNAKMADGNKLVDLNSFIDSKLMTVSDIMSQLKNCCHKPGEKAFLEIKPRFQDVLNRKNRGWVVHDQSTIHAVLMIEQSPRDINAAMVNLICVRRQSPKPPQPLLVLMMCLASTVAISNEKLLLDLEAAYPNTNQRYGEALVQKYESFAFERSTEKPKGEKVYMQALAADVFKYTIDQLKIIS
jgi:hypothetical protein